MSKVKNSDIGMNYESSVHYSVWNEIFWGFR